MANKKFSEFTLKTDPANVDFLVGYDGTDNVRIDPANLGGGGASDLNGLSDCLVDTGSLYVGEVPSGLSGNPQGNTVLGIDAGNGNTNGTENTNIGYQAGYSNATGTNRVCVGYEAGKNGTGNTGVFVGALAGQGSGTNNGTGSVGIGWGALRSYSTGNNNIAIGFQAARSIGGGVTDAVMVGNSAGYSNTANDVTLVGRDASRNNSATGTVSIGYQAGYSNTSGGNNTNIGYKAGYSTTTGASNTTLGYNTLGYHNGNNNVAIGGNAMQGSSSFTGTGADNVAIGYNAGGSGPTAYSNSVLIGKDAATSPVGASNFIVLGNASHTTLQIPGIQSGASDGDVLTYNASLGKLELAAAGGGGASSLNGLSDAVVNTTTLSSYLADVTNKASSSNIRNTVFGQNCFTSNTSGQQNVAMGVYCYHSSSSGSFSVAIGHGALGGATGSQGSANVAIGANALGNSQYTGGHQETVGIGRNAGQYYDGNGSVIIGNSAAQGQFSSRITGNNIIVLGDNASTSANNVSNEITLGNSSIATLRCAVTSITSLSDERDKSEIEDLSYGLAFIDALQPREFVWDNRPEIRIETDDEGNQTEVEFYSANKGKKDFGFIAQEVRELDNDTLRLVYTENEDKLEMSYGKLVPILVKAIQELKEEVELLKAK